MKIDIKMQINLWNILLTLHFPYIHFYDTDMDMNLCFK